MAKLKLLKSLSLNRLLISAMNNIQNQRILSRIPDHAVETFAADQIPLFWTRAAAFIFSTLSHDKSGLHWVAIYADKNDDA